MTVVHVGPSSLCDFWIWRDLKAVHNHIASEHSTTRAAKATRRAPTRTALTQPSLYRPRAPHTMAAKAILVLNGLMDLGVFAARKKVVAGMFSGMNGGTLAAATLVDTFGATLAFHGVLRILAAAYISTPLALPLATVSYIGEALPALWLVSSGRVSFKALQGPIGLPLGLLVVLLAFFRKSFGPKRAASSDHSLR